jgi:hypothetical protein
LPFRQSGAKSWLDFADYSDGADLVKSAGMLRQLQRLPKLTQRQPKQT